LVASDFSFNFNNQFLYNKNTIPKSKKTRQYKAIQGNTRQYKAIQGNTRQYKAIQGIQGNSRQFKAIQDNSIQFTRDDYTTCCNVLFQEIASVFM
jgi:hypothetical protein